MDFNGSIYHLFFKIISFFSVLSENLKSQWKETKYIFFKGGGTPSDTYPDGPRLHVTKVTPRNQPDLASSSLCISLPVSVYVSACAFVCPSVRPAVCLPIS